MRDRRFKSFDAELSTADRTISGYAAVWGVVDREGERVLRGAFSPAVARQKAGKSTAIAWSHNHLHGFPPIGHTTDLEEDDYGLRFEAVLDDTDFASSSLSAIKAGAVSGASAGFFIPTGGLLKSAEPGVFDIVAADLFEVSPCYRGMQDAAYVKSEEARQPSDELLERLGRELAHRLKSVGVAADMLNAFERLRNTADWIAWLAKNDDGTQTDQTKAAQAAELQAALAYVQALDLSKYSPTQEA